ncbi:MAG: SDR family oxidoreductase [Actinobacteria bacterium]|nr:SDR family oxidoreductase [Actinomycetota bacterium]
MHGTAGLFRSRAHERSSLRATTHRRWTADARRVHLQRHLPTTTCARSRTSTLGMDRRAARTRRRTPRCRCIAAQRRTRAGRRAEPHPVASRPGSDLLEQPHHHRQDRGQGPPARRDGLSRPATLHRRGHLPDGHRPSQQGPAQGTRSRRGGPARRGDRWPRRDVVRGPRPRIRSRRLPRCGASREHRPARSHQAVDARGQPDGRGPDLAADEPVGHRVPCRDRFRCQSGHPAHTRSVPRPSRPGRGSRRDHRPHPHRRRDPRQLAAPVSGRARIGHVPHHRRRHHCRARADQTLLGWAGALGHRRTTTTRRRTTARADRGPHQRPCRRHADPGRVHRRRPRLTGRHTANVAAMSGLAIVTGGARGIGAAIAAALLADGEVDEVAAFDLDINGAEAPAGVTLHQCDVTDEAQVRAVVASLGRQATVLVNNAGGGKAHPERTDNAPGDPFGPVDLFRESVDLNLTSAHVVTRVVGPGMARGSAICNTASIAGLMPNALFAYGAAKAGLIHWTKCMALALAPRGIRVNAVAPGFIYTRLWEQTLPRQMFDQMVGVAVPMASEQTPAQIADSVAFLCSQRAAQITGQVIAIDGGSLLGRAH